MCVCVCVCVCVYKYILAFCCLGYSTNLSGLNAIANEASTNSVFGNSSVDETGSISQSVEMEYPVTSKTFPTAHQVINNHEHLTNSKWVTLQKSTNNLHSNM